MRKHEITKKLDEIIDFSGCERCIDTPVKRYSSGMYVRLAFAVAAHLDPEILIVDEVLAVGDADFQKKCLGKMHDVAKHGRTVQGHIACSAGGPFGQSIKASKKRPSGTRHTLATNAVFPANNCISTCPIPLPTANCQLPTANCRLTCKSPPLQSRVSALSSRSTIREPRLSGQSVACIFSIPPYAEMKLIRCLRRANSSTFLQWHAEELSDTNLRMMVIPEGCAHGFQVLEPNSELLYLHTAMYYKGSEGAIRYNDQRLSIPWPIAVTDISDRDAGRPRLSDGFAGHLFQNAAESGDLHADI